MLRPANPRSSLLPLLNYRAEASGSAEHLDHGPVQLTGAEAEAPTVRVAPWDRQQGSGSMGAFLYLVNKIRSYGPLEKQAVERTESHGLQERSSQMGSFRWASFCHKEHSALPVCPALCPAVPPVQCGDKDFVTTLPGSMGVVPGMHSGISAR